MEDIKVTIIQSQLHWEDREKNLDMFEEKISAIKNQTNLIVLPEMFTTGFTMNAAKLAEQMDGKSVQWMKSISKKKNCVLTGSIIIETEGKFYNRLIWTNGDTIQHYDKRHLFSYAKEDKTFTAGVEKIITEINGWKILPLVCYDLRFPVWSRRTSDENYDLLIYAANWPERRVAAWNHLLVGRAIENQCYVIGLNRVGNDGNEIYHSGESAIIDFKGNKISGESFSNEFIDTITLHKKPLDDFRSQFAFFEDRDDFEIKT